MIPLAVPDLSGNESRYLRECIESTFVSTVGPFVGRFEELVSKAAGTRSAVATSAGTTALHVALVALGVGRDDLVVIPSFTFVATANAVSHAGATPWLLDVDRSSWTLDPARLDEALTRDTRRGPEGVIHVATGRRVSAIVAVHTFGHPADADTLRAIASEHGLPILTDAAASLGATYKDRPIGVDAGSAAVFSFNGNKTVTAGGGGAVVSDDIDLLARVRHLSSTARVGTDYDHDAVGFNYRMTNLQAAVGCAQMERLDRLVAAKRRIRATYDDAFADLPGIGPFPRVNWAESACWFSGIVTTDSPAAALRDKLRAAGVDARPTWKPMHLQVPYAGVPRGDLAVSDTIWSQIVTLPCSTGITDEDLGRVVDAVRDAIRTTRQ